MPLRRFYNRIARSTSHFRVGSVVDLPPAVMEVASLLCADLSELKDLPEAVLQHRQFFFCNYAQPIAQAFLCHGADLVTHRHRGSSVAGDRYQDRRTGLRRARQRYNDDRPSPFIEHSNRNYNARPCLANLGTEGGIERNPPDLTALRDYFHGSAIGSRISSKSFSISATSGFWFAISQARPNSRSRSVSFAASASLINRERSRDETRFRNCTASGSGTLNVIFLIAIRPYCQNSRCNPVVVRIHEGEPLHFSPNSMGRFC